MYIYVCIYCKLRNYYLIFININPPNQNFHYCPAIFSKIFYWNKKKNLQNLRDFKFYFTTLT